MAELKLEDWFPVSPLVGPPLPKWMEITWPPLVGPPSQEIYTPTAVLAAYNATSQSKRQATIVCDGIHDELAILEAVNLTSGPGGTVGYVQLTEGNFNVQALPEQVAAIYTAYNHKEPMVFRGVGRATIIDASGDLSSVIISQSRETLIENLSLRLAPGTGKYGLPARGISAIKRAGIIIRNIWYEGDPAYPTAGGDVDGNAIFLDNCDYSSISGCHINNPRRSAITIRGGICSLAFKNIVQNTGYDGIQLGGYYGVAYGNKLLNVRYAGIDAGGNYNFIIQNEVSKCGYGVGSMGDNIQSGSHNIFLKNIVKDVVYSPGLGLWARGNENLFLFNQVLNSPIGVKIVNATSRGNRIVLNDFIDCKKILLDEGTDTLFR